MYKKWAVNKPGSISDGVILFFGIIEYVCDAMCVVNGINSQVSSSTAFRRLNNIHQWASRSKKTPDNLPQIKVEILGFKQYLLIKYEQWTMSQTCAQQ